MKNLNLPILSPEGGLLRYLDEIQKFPMLSEQEEHSLAVEWADNKDIQAANLLVTSHLRLVAKIAQKYRGYGLPMMDVIAEGNIGLMIAVKKFEPSKGYRLTTYAIWWIKATIQEYILKSWSIVKMGTSAAHKKLFFNLRKIQNKLYHANNGNAPSNEVDIIANELNVSRDDVREMSQRFSSFEQSLNAPLYDNDDEGEVIELVAEPSESPETMALENNDYQYKKVRFDNAMLLLNDRERDVISERKLKEQPTTLDILSKKYGVSTERVRQIEERAMQKLTNAVA
jgi:RNA polymerase sigma-32 factor